MHGASGMKFPRRRAAALAGSLLVALLGGGCGSTAVGKAREAGSPSTEDANAFGPDALMAPDANPDGDVAIPSPDAPVVDAPLGVPSVQTVRFHLSGRAGWVVTEGNDCDPVAITEVASGRELVLALPAECRCECCQRDTFLTRAVPLAAGATVTWDAREAVVYYETIDCPYNGVRTQQLAHEVHRPVGPGRYRATFALVRAVPVGRSGFVTCQENADHTISCGLMGCGGPPPQRRRLCEPDTTEVEFDLPGSGDIDVAVVVP
jgi:hypothetical protein